MPKTMPRRGYKTKWIAISDYPEDIDPHKHHRGLSNRERAMIERKNYL
jgi:hypothetical protein